SAKADDPVNIDLSNKTETSSFTGCPAFAGHDESYQSLEPLVSSAQYGSPTKINVVPVPIGALAPTKETLAPLTWRVPTGPDARSEERRVGKDRESRGVDGE